MRYLETFDFKLVRKALKEREILSFKAPHLIKPVPFIMPFNVNIHAPWLIRLGIWFYDHLAKKSLPSSTSTLSRLEYKSLKLKYQKGIKYYDCWVDDARLVICNLQHAQKLGAHIQNYHQCISIKSEQKYWVISVLNVLTHEVIEIKAKALVNATGIWADQTNALINPKHFRKRLSLVQGSHIMVPKWYLGQHAYILQTNDKRVVFVIPDGKNAIIGTTDIAYEGSLEDIQISALEKEYLISVINVYFNIALNKSDIIHCYSGVRPLVKDGHNRLSKISREYVIEKEIHHELNLVNIYGGKLTTYRQLAEDVLKQLQTVFPNMKPAWTKKEKFPSASFDTLKQYYYDLRRQKSWLPKDLLLMYTRKYGTFTSVLLGEAQSTDDLGIDFGHGLFQIEIDYLLKYEWVKTIDDILWRRTKFGISMSEDDKSRLNQYISEYK